MSQLPIVRRAPAPSTPAVRLQAAQATRRRTPRRTLRPLPLRTHHRVHRRAAVAAGLRRIVAIAARMAPGGATSLLPTVLSAPAPSTRLVRPLQAVVALEGGTPL